MSMTDIPTQKHIWVFVHIKTYWVSVTSSFASNILVQKIKKKCQRAKWHSFLHKHHHLNHHHRAITLHQMCDGPKNYLVPLGWDGGAKKWTWSHGIYTGMLHTLQWLNYWMHELPSLRLKSLTSLPMKWQKASPWNGQVLMRRLHTDSVMGCRTHVTGWCHLERLWHWQVRIFIICLSIHPLPQEACQFLYHSLWITVTSQYLSKTTFCSKTH